MRPFARRTWNDALRKARRPRPHPDSVFHSGRPFSNLEFFDNSHLLDVGCGTGRVLSFFIQSNLPGKATGVELDPDIAACARTWTRRFENVDVLCDNALEMPLDAFTHVYLFNPFDTNVLMQFIMKVEAEARRPLTLVHMSDNGETYSYIGRSGWSLLRQGEFQSYQTATGRSFHVYDCPQHFSIWQFEPEA